MPANPQLPLATGSVETGSEGRCIWVVPMILNANGDLLTSGKAHKSRRNEFDLVCF